MRYRKLDANGDMMFGHGLQDFYIDSVLGVAQKVRTVILLIQGEWFLNISEGTNLMGGILGKHSKVTADATLRDRILSVEEVTNIEKYESTVDPVTRKFSVKVTINTIYGITTVEENNLGNF